MSVAKATETYFLTVLEAKAEGQQGWFLLEVLREKASLLSSDGHQRSLAYRISACLHIAFSLCVCVSLYKDTSHL